MDKHRQSRRLLRWWVSSNAATPEAFALVGEIERIIRLYLAELERLPDSGKREGPQLGDPIPAVEAMAYTLVENSPDLLEALVPKHLTGPMN